MKLPLKMSDDPVDVRRAPGSECETGIVVDGDGRPVVEYGELGSHAISCTPEFAAFVEGRLSGPLADHVPPHPQTDRVRAFVRAVVALENAWGLMLHAPTDVFIVVKRGEDPMVEDVIDRQKLDALDATPQDTGAMPNDR